MTTTTRTQRPTGTFTQTDPAQTEQEQSAEMTSRHRVSTLSGRLYRFHSLRVLDVNGESVGQVDWIWSNDARGDGEFIGVQLRWLRGAARAIPAQDVEIDMEARTLRLAYRKEQIDRAPYLPIDRALTADQKYGIRSHFVHERGAVANQPVADRLVA